jgi:hypothetical protein
MRSIHPGDEGEMMSRFNQPLQGKGARHPKTVRPAFFVIGAVVYSQLFYASVRPVETPIPRTAEGVLEISKSARRTFSADQRIEVKVTLMPGTEGADSEHTVRLLRRMREIGRRVLREERGQ